MIAEPRIVKFDFASDLKIDERASVLCSIKSGSPPFQFQWLKDASQLLSDGPISIVTVDDFSSLTFRQLKPNDAGNYTCVVRNGQGLDSHTAPLLVRCKLDSSYLKDALQQVSLILK